MMIAANDSPFNNICAASAAEPDGLPAFANRYLYESSTFERTGSLDELQIQEVRRPMPAPGSLLIAVKAAG